MTLRDVQERAAQLRMIAIEAGLLRLTQLIVVIDPKVHDSPRHFAMCSERVDEIRIAPQIANLHPAMIDGILMHEIGHAADFAYPARWRITHDWPSGRREIGLKLYPRHTSSGLRLWKRRDPYKVEVDADAIAEALFDVRIGYVGELAVQSTQGGIRPRPFGI